MWKGGQLNTERYKQGLKAKEFFLKFFAADCQKVAVENPVQSAIFDLPPYTQEIQPFMFGDPYTKKTRLWLKGLPMLMATDIVVPEKTLCPSSCSRNAGTDKNKGTAKTAKDRAKTFPGIARAMAEQWAGKESNTVHLFAPKTEVHQMELIDCLGDGA